MVGVRGLNFNPRRMVIAAMLFGYDINGLNIPGVLKALAGENFEKLLPVIVNELSNGLEIHPVGDPL
jgi:hypothetical protein